MRQLHEVPGVGKSKKKTHPLVTTIAAGMILCVVGLISGASAFGFILGADLASRFLDALGG